MVDFTNLRTIKQLAEEAGPIFTAGKLRWLIHNAEKNGLHIAIVRVGGRIYLDREAFNQWLESLKSSPSTTKEKQPDSRFQPIHPVQS